MAGERRGGASSSSHSSPLVEPLRINKSLGKPNDCSPVGSNVSIPAPFSNGNTARQYRGEGSSPVYLTAGSSSQHNHSPYGNSPLFEHVQQHTSRSASSHDSDSTSSFHPPSPLPLHVKDKTLPKLPPSDDDAQNHHSSHESTVSSSNFQDGSFSVDELPSIHRSGQSKSRQQNSSSPLFGLGVAASTDSSVAGPSNESASNWNYRRAAMKAASHTAGAGIVKFGKASAAKLKQTQQRQPPKSRDGVSPLMGALGMNTGLWRQDARAARSAVDLPTSSQRDEYQPSAIPSVSHSNPDPHIGLPTDVKHNVHVDVGPSGYTGLPMSWAKVLAQNGINAEEVRRNPTGASNLVKAHTEYHMNEEAERGQDRDDTKRLLQSKLDDYTDLKDAVIATSNRRPSNGTSTLHSDTTPKAAGRRGSGASTSYSSVLDTGWPSPTWSDTPSVPRSPFTLGNGPSPSLPQVQSDDDDWASSLLSSIPASSSKGKLSEHQVKSFGAIDKFNIIGTLQGDFTDEGEQQEHLQSFRSDGEEDSFGEYEEEETPSIATATKGIAGVAKLYRPSQLGHPSTLFRESQDSALTRKKSGSSNAHSTSNHSHPGQHQLSSSSPSPSHDVSPSGSSYGDHSSSLNTTVHGTSSPIPNASISTSPNGISKLSSSSNLSSSAETSTTTSMGLRERRKASPRIYPPSTSKFIPKEENLSPFSAHGSRRTSGGATSDNSSRLSPNPKRRDSNKVELSISSNASPPRRESAPSNTPQQANLFERKGQLDEHQASGKDSNVYSLSSSIIAEGFRQESVPPLPPKAARVPPGHNTPDFILPDRDGFYTIGNPTSRQSESGTTPIISIGTGYLSPPNASPIESRGLPSVSSPLQFSFSARSTSPQAIKSPSNVEVANFAGTTALQTGEGRESFAEGANSHEAADFIEDWLKDDTYSVSDSESPSMSNFSPDSITTASHHRLSPRLAMSRLALSTNHQSPSPALLQGIPSPLRNSFGVYISQRVAEPLAPPSIETSHDWQEVQNAQEGTRGKRQAENQTEHVSTNRDWRTRSLPAPPSPMTSSIELSSEVDGEEEKEGEEPYSDEDRASVTSLPIDSARGRETNNHGPPHADSRAMEAAAVLTNSTSRSSSQRSYASSSTRNGGGVRRVTRPPRRSTDAKRFPVSMHYDNESVYDHDRESQHSLSFSEMVKARQSMDLDDVMPFDMNNGSELNIVPPVPPLPSKTSIMEGWTMESKADYPEPVRHVLTLLRPEKPTSVFGELVRIGEGESGHVYSTIPRPDSSVPSVKGRGKVAIKVVSFPLADDESATRFKNLDQEIRLWKQSHPHRNIVTLFDIFVCHGQEQIHPGVWIAQEFMSLSLADLIGLKSSGLQLTEAHMSRIFLDATLALEHLHHQGIIHRDVRSDNVLLTLDGLSKLTDFTHATRLQEEKKENSVVGTAYWMAPEVVKAEYYNDKVDIWSLGVVLYEMVQGDPPRVDFPALRAITLTAKLGLPGLSQPDRHSSALRQCLAWCTEMEPAKRPSADLLPHVSPGQERTMVEICIADP